MRAGVFGWLVRYYVFTSFVLLLVLAWGSLQLYRYFAADLPDVQDVERYEELAPGVTRIHGEDGTLLAELAREHRAYVPFEDIPQPLVHAFLAAEDRRFHEHVGLDFRGLARAFVANVRSGTVVQGGSTITQQVSKSFLVNQERTLARKVREAILALRIESRLGKARILEIYLNKIFLGHGAYGVGAASSRYFDKDLDELTLAESALIAGLARAPSRYSPMANPELALERRAVILQTMVESGYISEAERDEAKAEPLSLVSVRDPFRWRAPAYAEHVRQVVMAEFGEESVLQDGLTIETAADMVVERYARESVDHAVRKQDRRMGWRGPEAHLRTDEAKAEFDRRLTAAYGTDPLATDAWRLGLVASVDRRLARVDVGAVQADLPLQHASWAAPYDRFSGVNDQHTSRLDDVLEVGDVVWVRRHVKVGSDGEPVPPKDGIVDDASAFELELGQTPIVEAALYIYDHQTGYVEAMAGGRDYDHSQFNRTTQACRQPGSVFKTYYYALALDGFEFKMDTVLEAKPWEPEPGEEWNPRNIGKTLDGKVLLRTAFIKSLNTPSIRLFVRLGADEVVRWTRHLGVTTPLIADKGLSLGASCMRTDELTRSFATFARGGSERDPVYVRRITDKQGRVRLDQRHPADPAMDVAGRLDRMAAEALEGPEQLVDERTAWLINRLMREVVTSGTGAKASRIGAPAAGKSGTASGRFKRGTKTYDLTTDTWFVGFTSRHAVSAWVGFDDAQQRSLGDDDASYTTATPMWTHFMKRVVVGLAHEKLGEDRPPGISSRVVDATHGGPPVDGLPQATVYAKERN